MTPQPLKFTDLPITTRAVAERWMDQGVKKLAEFRRLFNDAKISALESGYAFYKARIAIGEGNFELLIETYETKGMSRTTVYRAVAFVTEVLSWAAKQFPDKSGNLEALLVEGRKMVLQSPKGYIALCRQLQLMRKFGEYDEVKYAQNKIKGGARQVEFDFIDVCEALDVITQLGKPDVIWKLPEGKQTPEALRELKTKLDTASAQVAEQLKNQEAINVAEPAAADPIPKFSAYVNRWGTLCVETYNFDNEISWFKEPSIAAVIRGVSGLSYPEAFSEAKRRYLADECDLTPCGEASGKPKLKN